MASKRKPEEAVTPIEIRERVAREVMGLPNVSLRNGYQLFWSIWPDLNLCPVPEYPTDIAAAWQVVEKLWYTFWPPGTGGPRLECHVYPDADGWHCDVVYEAGAALAGSAVAETAPMAICLAALAALEAK